MKRQQLFTLYHVTLPDTVLRTRDNQRIYEKEISSFPFMHWPNGGPCEAVNMYLLDKASSITGDTLKTYASELSHLVRYCGTRGHAFEDLNDSTIFELSKHLQAERALKHPTERARNNNTVRTILSRTLLFLNWYQYNLMLPTEGLLIGEKRQSPRIVVQVKTNNKKRYNNTYYTHRAMPASVSQEPKRPISQSIIEDIELMIENLSSLEAQSEPTLRRYQGDIDSYKAQLEYVEQGVGL